MHTFPVASVWRTPDRADVCGWLAAAERLKNAGLPSSSGKDAPALLQRVECHDGQQMVRAAPILPHGEQVWNVSPFACARCVKTRGFAGSVKRPNFWHLQLSCPRPCRQEAAFVARCAWLQPVFTSKDKKLASFLPLPRLKLPCSCPCLQEAACGARQYHLH